MALLTAFGLAWAALAEETARPARGPIVYDSYWQVHHVDPGVRLPGDDDAERARSRTAPTSRGGFGDDSTLRGPAPMFIPPPQAPSQTDGRRRNWIVPTLEDGPVRRAREEDEQPEPSGWGWLADEIDERRRVRDADYEETVSEREEAEAAFTRQPRDREGAGLFIDFVTASEAGVREDAEDRANQYMTPAGMDRNEQRIAALEETGAARDDAPYGRVDPWDTELVNASPWDPDATVSAFAPSIGNPFLSSQQNGSTPVGNAGREPASFTRGAAPDRFSSSPQVRESSLAPASGIRESRFQADTSVGAGSTFGSGNQAGGAGSFGGTSTFAPATVSDTRWSAGWSGDSGWRDGMQPATTVTRPTPMPPVHSHNNGWLASPDR